MSDMKARINENRRKHIAVLNRLEPHLGCVLCRGPVSAGRCPKCQNRDGSLRVNPR